MFYLLNSFVVLQLGGLNSLLGVEMSPSLPIVSKAPTLILGMDVSHGSPGQSDIPSIAAVSDNWFCVFSTKRICFQMIMLVLRSYFLDILLVPLCVSLCALCLNMHL